MAESRAARVLRRRDEGHTDGCVLERDTLGRQRIMVWGEIVLNQKIESVSFQNICEGRSNGVTTAPYIES